MKGSIFQRRRKDEEGNLVPFGNYRIKICLGKNPATGKYASYYETLPDGSSKGDAQRRLRELLCQLDRGTFVKPEKMTLGNYLETWLQDTALPNMSPRTFEGYEYAVRKYILPALGQIPLTQLKPQHLQHLYSKIQTAGRSRTCEYVHFTLRKALQDAVKMGILAHNPTDAVERPRVEKREMHTMSEGELHLFLEYSRATPYYALFYTLLFSGMRRSEILALKWADVDLVLCQLSVNRSIHSLRYGTYRGQTIVKQPKTARGRRTIALTPSNAIVLREYRAQQEALRQQLGLPQLIDDDFLFARYNGKPYLPDTISHAWLKLGRRTGINVRLHDARHTHASLMLKQGVHPKVVCERLGHHSVEITLDTYSHVAPGLQQAAANHFDDIVMAKEKEEATK